MWDNNIVFLLYVDVAISAPFGDQPGTIYIYAGAGSDILNQNPIQVSNIMLLAICILA